MPELVSGKAFYWHGVRALAKLFAEEAFDIVHTVLIQSDILGAFAARFHPSPVLISSSPGYPYRSKTASWKKLIYKISYSSIRSDFDRIVPASHQTGNDLVRNFRVAPSQIKVIHNSIAEEAIRATHDWPAPDIRQPLVGTVASLIPEKGVADFLEAARLVRNWVPEARFIIVGDGPERGHLELLAEQLDLSGVLEFAGWVSPCMQAIRRMDIFVFASYEEGLPYVVLEAMTCRRPVVSYAVGGISEAVTDGKHGLLVELGDVRCLAEAVLRCIENPEWARQLGKSARRRVETDFRATDKVPALERVYEDVLSNRSSNGFDG